LPVLNYFDIKQLNWTVMSHPHADHIGGLVSVVEEIHTDTLWDSYADYDSWTYNHLLDRYSNAGTEIITPNSGDILVISPLESIHILAPDSSFVKQSHNINNASIVFKLTVGETSLLFTGDIEKEGDERLLNFGEYLKTDVLKVAHHGSITSTSNALLKFISPVIAVVSVGEGNKFSHPSAGVMDRFSSQGITIHRTDHKGALWLQMDGHNIWEKNWK
jgi:competence protein ComEC